MGIGIRRVAGASIAAFGLVAALLLAAPAAQAAVTWTPLASGTTQQIAGVDYKGNTIAYVTSSGEIFTGPAGGPFTRLVNAPGTFFTEVALSPSGTRGTAVARGDDNGELYVYNGSGWAKADLSTASVLSTNNCANPPVPRGVGPVENVEFTGIAWASDTVGYVVGERKTGASGHARYALKTTNGGATWTDMQNRPDGTCMMTGVTFATLASVHTTPGLVWITGDHNNGSPLFVSSNGLTSVNVAGNTRKPMLAIDPNNTQRQMGATSSGAAYHSWAYTDDLWNSSDWAGREGGHDDTKTIRSLKAAPNGWFYIAGDGGLIERTKNMTHAEALPAAGALATQDWRAIALADSARAVVAGAGGALAISSTANQPVTDPASPGPGAPPAGSPGAGAPPAVTSPSISNRTLRPGQGTTFAFNASKAGRAVLTVEKKFKGIKVKRRVKTKSGARRARQVCVVSTKKRLRVLRRQAKNAQAYRKLLRRKTCRSFTRVGRITRQVRPGRNTIRFNGRIAGRKLGPGVYRAKLIVTDSAGQRSSAEAFRFRVVANKKRRR